MNGPKAAAASPRRVIQRNATTIIVSMTALVLLGASSTNDRSPLLVWNASASVPIGLYWISASPPVVGSLVLVRPGGAAAKLARRRGYLPKSAYLLKPVAATAGEFVCRNGAHIALRRRYVARARLRDAAGRRMPIWLGCRTLRPGELFLLANHPGSFDSRYFGPIDAGQVAGVATFVWPLRRD